MEVGSAGDGGRSGSSGWRPGSGLSCDSKGSGAVDEEGIGTGSDRSSSGGPIYNGTGSVCRSVG